MYDLRPNTIIGFHDCDLTILNKIVANPNQIEINDIAYFYMENGTVLVQLMNEETPIPANESSLVAVKQNSNYFFRSVSRRYVAALHAIEECKERGDGGLLITLKPHHFTLEVPKPRGQELESWILENVSIEKE